MYYRRKVILGLLQTFGGKLGKIELQKLLFLVCKKQSEPEYDFIPYHYGCFSHSAKADLNKMVGKGLVSEEENSYYKKDRTDYLSQLKEIDKRLVIQAHLVYNKYDSDSLMRYTYINFPYYAINSQSATRLLSFEQLVAVDDIRPRAGTPGLYTIGYEGVSLEAYLNKLIQNGITALVDVRNNPLSQKFGFSKQALQGYCKGLNIAYFHFPDVGIQSEYRQELNSQADYDKLFTVYRKKTLSRTVSTQEKILELIKNHGRIALTCFEANICQCHRTHLAQAITRLPGWQYELKYL